MIFTVLRKFLEMGRLHSSQKYFWSTYLSQMTTCLMGQERTPPVAKLREGHTMEFAHKNPTNNYPLWFYWFRVANESSFISLLRSTPLPKPDLIRYQKYPKLMVFDSKTYLLSIFFFWHISMLAFGGVPESFSPFFCVFPETFPPPICRSISNCTPPQPPERYWKATRPWSFLPKKTMSSWDFLGVSPYGYRMVYSPNTSDDLILRYRYSILYHH